MIIYKPVSKKSRAVQNPQIHGSQYQIPHFGVNHRITVGIIVLS